MPQGTYAGTAPSLSTRMGSCADPGVEGRLPPAGSDRKREVEGMALGAPFSRGIHLTGGAP